MITQVPCCRAQTILLKSMTHGECPLISANLKVEGELITNLWPQAGCWLTVSSVPPTVALYIGPCMVYLDSCSRTSWPSIEKYRGKSSQNCHVVLFWEPNASKNLMHWVLSCICLRSIEGLNIVKDKSWYAIIVLLMLSQVDPGLLSLSQKYSEPILIKVATKWEISNWKYGNCYVFGEFATQTKTLIAVLNGGQIIAIQLLKCSD